MAATATVTIKVEVAGLGTTNNLPIEFIHSVTPEEVVGPVYAVIGNTAQDLNLGPIAPEDILGVLIIARVDGTSIQISTDGTGTPASGVDMTIEGDSNESVYLNFTDGITDTNGSIRVKGDAATASIEYFVFGKQA